MDYLLHTEYIKCPKSQAGREGERFPYREARSPQGRERLEERLPGHDLHPVKLIRIGRRADDETRDAAVFRLERPKPREVRPRYGRWVAGDAPLGDTPLVKTVP